MQKGDIHEFLMKNSCVIKMKILVTPTSFKSKTNKKAIEKLHSFADEIIYNDYGRPLTSIELKEMIKDCDGYIAGLDYIDKEVIENANNLKVISRYGSGCDRVDINACIENGVILTNTPGSNSNAVAELTLGLLLSVIRKIPMLDQNTKSGGWIRNTGIELSNKTIGIIGLGAIGKCVAKGAQGFSMKVLAYDPYIDLEYAKSNDVQPVDLEYLIKNSDVLSLHVPLNNDTKNIISYKEFELMKDNVILINTSRGGLINESATIEYLKNGKLGGLGLDAFQDEPPKNCKDFQFDNVVLTPHTGAHTSEATEKMALMAVDNLINILSGNKCEYIVTKN